MQVTIPFGKHKNKPLNEVPSNYLEWCIENLDWDKYPNSKFTKAAAQQALKDKDAAKDNSPKDSNDEPRWKAVSDRLKKLPIAVIDFEKIWSPNRNKMDFMEDLASLVEGIQKGNQKAAVDPDLGF